MTYKSLIECQDTGWCWYCQEEPASVNREVGEGPFLVELPTCEKCKAKREETDE